MIGGIGVDIVDVARAAGLIARFPHRAFEKLLTTEEAGYCASRPNPALHFAARLAAKEACFKALAGSTTARGIGWREIEVAHESDGRPRVVLHGRARVRAAEMGVTSVYLSISHSDSAAIAFAVAECG